MNASIFTAINLINCVSRASSNNPVYLLSSFDTFAQILASFSFSRSRRPSVYPSSFRVQKVQRNAAGKTERLFLRSRYAFVTIFLLFVRVIKMSPRYKFECALSYVKHRGERHDRLMEFAVPMRQGPIAGVL